MNSRETNWLNTCIFICMVNMIYRHGNHLRLEDHTGNSSTSTSMGVLGHKKLLE